MSSFDKNALIDAMRNMFGVDTRRIQHALHVLKYAEMIMVDEPGNRDIIVAAAIVHDIGIPQCEKKYGHAGGQMQEEEGPPVARPLLKACGLSADAIEHVCLIIASHHSPGELDTPEFKILWDADWMVNFPEELELDDLEQTQTFIDRIFLTCVGRTLACTEFL